VTRLRRGLDLLIVAYQRFVLHDGWAIASHIALSVLMSLFPFLILLTAVASFFGTGTLADEAADIILEAWPESVAKPIALEVHNILTGRRSDIFTVGLVLALYFASSGVESLRVGLNRAYGAREMRAWWIVRLESIFFVVFGAVVMLAFALFVVLFPLGWRWAVAWVPDLEPLGFLLGFLRLGVTTLLIIVALVLAHTLIAAGRRSVRRVLPGIGLTLVMWIVGGIGFGWYLEEYPGAYASTYGGLATAMIALVFLYTLSAIFLFGGELNGALIAARKQRLRPLENTAALQNVVKMP
jgi:membrane protein